MTSDTRPSTLPRLDLSALRQAFMNAGLVWVIPANLFEESVETTAREYSRLLEERPKVAPESEAEKREAFGK